MYRKKARKSLLKIWNRVLSIIHQCYCGYKNAISKTDQTRTYQQTHPKQKEAHVQYEKWSGWYRHISQEGKENQVANQHQKLYKTRECKPPAILPTNNPPPTLCPEGQENQGREECWCRWKCNETSHVTPERHTVRDSVFYNQKAEPTIENCPPQPAQTSFWVRTAVLSISVGISTSPSVSPWPQL